MRYHSFVDKPLRDDVMRKVLDCADPMTANEASKILKVNRKTVKSWANKLRTNGIVVYGSTKVKSEEVVQSTSKSMPPGSASTQSCPMCQCNGNQNMDKLVNLLNEPLFVVKAHALNEKLVPNSLVLEYEDGTSHEYGHRQTHIKGGESPTMYYKCIACSNLCRKGTIDNGSAASQPGSTLKFCNGKVQFICEAHHERCIPTKKWKQLATIISREGKLNVKEKKKKAKRAWLDDIKLAMYKGEEEGLSDDDLQLLISSFGTWPNSSYLRFGRMQHDSEI